MRKVRKEKKKVNLFSSIFVVDHFRLALSVLSIEGECDSSKSMQSALEQERTR